MQPQEFITGKPRQFFLSKSRFIRGLQCHKALWLLTHRPELQDKISAAQQAVFDSGSDVGKVAQGLLPNGVEVPYEGMKVSQQLAMTEKEISKGTTTIYEAAFKYAGIFAKVDILHSGPDGWELYEVKGSTGVKEVYLNDIAVQYFIAVGAGLKISKANIVYINNTYTRNGDIDVHGIFYIEDVTDIIHEKQDYIAGEIKRQQEMLATSMPSIDIGPHCFDTYECSFHGHCWQHIPSPSVFDFADIGKPDAFALYRQRIVKMQDVPTEDLGWRQLLQCDGVIHKKNHFDQAAVTQFLEALWYPLAFLDFETTCLTAVPLFDGTKPYQAVPFQYSLHVQKDDEPAAVEHYEFLADGDSDPRRPFIESLLSSVPQGACVITYNKSFEQRILRDLAASCPEYADRIAAVIEGMVDLMAPFRAKHVYHWQFNGSYSIKSVLPALVPGLSYEDLEIKDGGLAADNWLRMRSGVSREEEMKIRADLLAYCKLDTWAMVEILKWLKDMVKLSAPALSEGQWI